MLQAVINYVVAMILTKELVIATDQCTEHQFKSPFFLDVSCEDIYNKNPESHNCSGYYWTAKKVFCGMTYTGSSCDYIYNKYPEIYKNDPKEKSGYYRLNSNQWIYCNMTEIAAKDEGFIYNCAAVEVIKSTYQSFLPGESCESIYNNNAESHEWSGHYWITSRLYCEMSYTGSSCEDIYNNHPSTIDKSGYYRINDSQWTYCNMTAIPIANGDFITTCAGMGGGWRRIANINISAGDDCPGQWRKATHSNVSFCRATRRCVGELEDTRKETLLHSGQVMTIIALALKILNKVMFLDYQSLMEDLAIVSIFGLTLVVAVRGINQYTVVLVLIINQPIPWISLVITTTVKQGLLIEAIMMYTI